MSNDYSLSDIQRALNEKKAKQSAQRQNLVESMAQQMPVKHVSEEDKRYQVTEQRLTALANRVENLMGMSGRLSLVEDQANTLVSGIGHNAMGASQGSGIVNVADADDTELQGISHGETIRWDSTLQKFTPAQGGSGGGAGTLKDTLFLGNEADREILFEDNHGLIHNVGMTPDIHGKMEWRTAVNNQGDVYKSEVFYNDLDNAKVVQIDTKYDRDHDKGIYLEASASGIPGGVTLQNFESPFVDWTDDTLKRRLINAETLNNRIEAEHAILHVVKIQKQNFATADAIPGSFHTEGVTKLELVTRIGLHNLLADNQPVLPSHVDRYPIDSYILIEKLGSSDYGLYTIASDPIFRGDCTEFMLNLVDANGEIVFDETANIYAFNKNYDLTLLQFLLHEIEARVEKQGDRMTGGLVIENADKVADPVSFEIKGIQSGGGSSNYIFSSHLDSKGRDICEYHGPIEGATEVVNKRYVDSLIQNLSGGLRYIGDLDPNIDTPASLDPNALAGDFYIFGASGDWEGEDVKNHDYLIYDGTDWKVLHRDIDDDFLPINGGTLTGSLQMSDGSTISMNGLTPIKTRRIDSGNNSNLEFFRDNDKKLQLASDSVQVFEDLSLQANSDFKVRNGCQVHSGNKYIMTLYGNSVRYHGEETTDDSIVTKKYVDDLVGNTTVTGDFVPLDGSEEMTGNLQIVNHKNNNTAAGLVLDGYRAQSNNPSSSATITFKNGRLSDDATNTGYLTFRAANGSNWFNFNQKVDFQKGTKITGLTETTNLKVTGTDSTIKHLDISMGTDAVSLRVGGRTMFKKKDEAIDGSNIFEIFGDKVLYHGTVTDERSVVTKRYVEDTFDALTVDSAAIAKTVTSVPDDAPRGQLFKIGDQLFMKL